jgi:hypothetical protein
VSHRHTPVSVISLSYKYLVLSLSVYKIPWWLMGKLHCSIIRSRRTIGSFVRNLRWMTDVVRCLVVPSRLDFHSRCG